MVEMKRFRFGEKGESIDLHGIVDALMQLPRSKEDVDAPPVAARHKRAFECKTCSKRFSSFQALGGHRTSHKKPRLSGDDRDLQAQSGLIMSKSKAHECSVCGLEFALGQALGGHMRRHRASDDQGFGRGLANKSSNLQRGSVVDTELRLGIGLDHKDWTPTAIDFFH